MKNFIIPFALLALMTACGGNNNGKSQENVEQNNKVMTLNIDNFKWTRQPESYVIKGDTIEVVTKPGTDLWQRTYYHFRNDNAPVFQMETEEKFFSFVVKTDFTESHHRFDKSKKKKKKPAKKSADNSALRQQDHAGQQPNNNQRPQNDNRRGQGNVPKPQSEGPRQPNGEQRGPRPNRQQGNGQQRRNKQQQPQQRKPRPQDNNENA